MDVDAISLPAQQRRRPRPVASARSPHSVWHIVRAVGRSDREVSAALTNLGFASYYPRVLEMRPLAKRQMSARQRRAEIEISRPQLVPLFPRYLFVRFDRGRDGWRDVFGVVGVAGLVCEFGLPVPISQRVIDRIRAIETDGTVIARNEKLRTIFRLGQQVRINSGPFAELRATMQTALDQPCDEVDAGTRVKILINVFGGNSLVELDIWQLEAV